MPIWDLSGAFYRPSDITMRKGVALNPTELKRDQRSMPDRIKLSLKRDEALRATRVTVGKMKLVYLLIADKRLKYKNGKSRIVYIGTTKKGVARIAQSAASRAE